MRNIGENVEEALTLETVSKYFIRVPGSKDIRMTAAGKTHFREKFADVGYCVDNIKSVGQFFVAHNAYLRKYFESIVLDRATEPAIKALLTQ